VGLANVDERLRAAFGDAFGLVVETALGAGTKVSVRVPKFRPDVRARAES
jgi:two-component system LytT family sensor kinase